MNTKTKPATTPNGTLVKQPLPYVRMTSTSVNYPTVNEIPVPKSYVQHRRSYRVVGKRLHLNPNTPDGNRKTILDANKMTGAQLRALGIGDRQTLGNALLGKKVQSGGEASAKEYEAYNQAEARLRKYVWNKTAEVAKRNVLHAQKQLEDARKHQRQVEARIKGLTAKLAHAEKVLSGK